MSSRMNEMENEGLIVIGRRIGNEWETPEEVQAVAATVDAWGKKLSLPLGLVYCGTTINWPEDVEFTPIVIGLITFSGYGDDDEPVAGQVGPESMDVSRASAIPDGFWQALADEHQVDFSGDVDVYLAAAGWTWVRLAKDGESVCGTSTEDDGFRVIPVEARTGTYEMTVGYC